MKPNQKNIMLSFFAKNVLLLTNKVTYLIQVNGQTITNSEEALSLMTGGGDVTFLIAHQLSPRSQLPLVIKNIRPGGSRKVTGNK